MLRVIVLTILALLIGLHAAYADCLDPPGEEGVMVFNTTHAAMQFCNGEHWISLGGGGEAGPAHGADGAWDAVDLQDTGPFATDCKYRARRGSAWHYMRSVSDTTLLFDAPIAEFKFGAIESTSKNQFWYRGDGSTGTTSGTPSAIDEIQHKCVIDTEPDAIAFNDVTGASVNTVVASNVVTIAGINQPVSVSASGDGNPEISIDGGAWATSGSINAGETLQVRVLSSALNSTAHEMTISFGAADVGWSVTTEAGAPPDTTPPVWTTPAGTIATITTGASLSANVVGTDNSGSVSYLKTGGDSWISVSATGVVTGTAPGSAGTYSVSVRLSDAAGQFVDRTFSVVVNAPGAGCTWTVASAAEANNWRSIAYGAGRFIAVATSGTNRMMTSADGVSWSPVAGIAAHWWTSVIYANGKFVAVSGGSTMSSADGLTWTTPVNTPQGSFEGVAYGNGKYVAVGYGNTGSAYHAMTSTDGVTWTGNTFMAGKQWEDIAFGNGRFVAVAGDGSSQAAMTSTDGVNWTLGSLNGAFDGVTFANGVFYTSSGSTLYSSTDGLTWASQAVPTAARHGAWLGAIYAGGRIMGVGQGISTTWSGSVTSEDGSNWAKGTVPQNTNTWTSVAYGAGKYVAVASSGTNRVMWTDCGDAPPADTTPDAFAFTDVTGAALSTLTTSANVTISGIDASTPVSVTGAGAQISINGGAWGTSGTITNGQTLAVRLTSSASNSTAVTTTVTVGGVIDTWSVTTEDSGGGSDIVVDETVVVTGSTVTIPASVIDGDILVLADRRKSSSPATVLPAGFTELANIRGGNDPDARQMISYKIATNTDAGTTITGMASGHKILVVFRANAASVTPSVFTQQYSASDPSPQTIASGSVSSLVIAFAAYGTSSNIVDVRSMTPAKDDERTADNDFWAAWKVFNSSPVNVTIDMNDEGTLNILQGGYLAVTQASGGGSDTTPDAFAFTDVTGAALSTLTTSANVTISGIDASTPVSVTGSGAQISINGGAWGTSGNITNGQTLAVRTTASASFNTATTASVTVGGVSDTWSVTTRAPNGCSNTTINWSSACSTASGSMTHNQNKTITNAASGYTGTRDLTCTDGTISQSGGSCAVVGSYCDPGDANWCGTIGDGVIGTTNAGGTSSCFSWCGSQGARYCVYNVDTGDCTAYSDPGGDSACYSGTQRAPCN